eukprot:g6219.t1
MNGISKEIKLPTPNADIFHKGLARKMKQEGRSMLRGLNKIKNSKLSAMAVAQNLPRVETKVFQPPKIKAEKPITTKAKNHYSSTSKDMVAAMSKELVNAEVGKDKKSSLKTPKNIISNVVLPKPPQNPHASTISPTPALSITDATRPSHSLKKDDRTNLQTATSKRIACPPIIALPRNDLDPNQVHTEVDYGAGNNAGCKRGKPANCPNAQNGGSCGGKVMDKEKEMALNQARVAAKAGDVDIARISIDMSNKPGSFKPLPVNSPDGQPKPNVHNNGAKKLGIEDLQRGPAERGDVVKSINIPIGRNSALIQTTSKKLLLRPEDEPGINNVALDEDTPLDETDPAIERLLNPALKKGTVFDDANTAKAGKKDPRVTADNPVGTKLTDIDTSGSNKKHMATMTSLHVELAVQEVRLESTVPEQVVQEVCPKDELYCPPGQLVQLL